jgi:hypothetical protein
MGFIKIIEIADKQFREELDDYYIVSKSRINNLVSCFEQQADHIKRLTKIISEQQEKLADFEKILITEKEFKRET